MSYLKRITNFYFKHDPIIFWSNTLSLLLAFFILCFYALVFDSLPPKLPLFYSLPWGENQLVSLPQFAVLPSLILMVMLVNLIISWNLHTSQILIRRILSIGSSLVALLILVTALKILFIFI